MERNHLKDQLNKYFRNELELDELKAFLTEIDNLSDAELAEWLDQETFDSLEHAKLDSLAKAAMEEKLLAKAQAQARPVPQLSGKRRMLPWAALAAAVLLFALFYGLYQNRVKQTDLVQEHALLNEINLNEAAPLIKFRDGNILELDSNQSYQQAQMQFDVDSAGLVSYKASEQAEQQVLTFSSPKGKVSSIQLSDGTLVWLNSASTISFRPNFDSKQRQVQLTGEAYFEVAPNKDRPFLVQTKQSTTQVLGTGFNIASYPNEQHTVTLMHGSIQMHTDKAALLLKPNQQASITSDGKIATRNVDTDQVLAWKEGDFIFRDNSIQEIMSSLQQWYDIDEVVFEGKSSELFTGSIKRSKRLSQLLKQLELISSMKFRIAERRVYVQLN